MHFDIDENWIKIKIRNRANTISLCFGDLNRAKTCLLSCFTNYNSRILNLNLQVFSKVFITPHLSRISFWYQSNKIGPLIHYITLTTVVYDVSFFFFFDLGFMALSITFHLYRSFIKGGQKLENPGVCVCVCVCVGGGGTTWPSVSRTWLSHIHLTRVRLKLQRWET